MIKKRGLSEPEIITEVRKNNRILKKEVQNQKKINYIILTEKELDQWLYDYHFTYFQNITIDQSNCIKNYMYYFFFWKSSIYFRLPCNQISKPLSNYHELFNVLFLDATNDEKFNSMLFNILLRLLDLMKNKVISMPLDSFKANYSILDSIDLLDYPAKYFYYDGHNMFYHVYNVRNKSELHMCVYSQVFHDLLKNITQKSSVPISFQKNLYKYIKKCLPIKNYNLRISKSFSLNYNNKKYTIDFNLETSSWKILGHNNLDYFSTIKLNAFPSQDSIIDKIYSSFCGNIELLNFFSALYMTLFLESSKKSLYIIETDNIISSCKLLESFDIIYFSSLNSIKNKENYIDLINLNYLYQPVVLTLTDDISADMTSNDISLIRNLLLEKTINRPDPVVNKLSLINHFPLLLISNNARHIQSLKNNLPVTSISMNTNFICRLPMNFFNSFDYLSLFFVNGIYQLQNSKKRRKSPIRNSLHLLDNENEIEFFLYSFCYTPDSKDSKPFTYGDTLYNSYCEYHHLIHTALPIKKRIFIQIIKLSGLYPYKRPHVSRDVPNKMAFMNIKIDYNKLDRYKEENINASGFLTKEQFTESFAAVNYDDFYNKLISMDK